MQSYVSREIHHFAGKTFKDDPARQYEVLKAVLSSEKLLRKVGFRNKKKSRSLFGPLVMFFLYARTPATRRRIEPPTGRRMQPLLPGPRSSCSIHNSFGDRVKFDFKENFAMSRDSQLNLHSPADDAGEKAFEKIVKRYGSTDPGSVRLTADSGRMIPTVRTDSGTTVAFHPKLRHR